MGAVFDFLTGTIRKLIENYGIVIWYDQEKCYEVFAKQLELQGCEKHIFKESYFELRHNLKSLMDGESKPKVLIYVPKSRASSRQALIGLEQVGCYLEPGHPSRQMNTKLEVIARAALKKIKSKEEIDDICVKITHGQMELKDIDIIIATVLGAGTSLQLVFGSKEPLEISLRFIGDSEIDKEVVKKGAKNELLQLFEQSLGILLSQDKDLSEIRGLFHKMVLLGDFVTCFPEGEVPPKFSSMNLPKNQHPKEETSRLAQKWRTHPQYRELYVQVATATEKEFGVEQLSIPMDSLINTQTFRITETRLLELVSQKMVSHQFEGLEAILEKKRKHFWALEDPPLGFRWALIHTALLVLLKSDQISSEFKEVKYTPAALIHKYCSGDSPWFGLDRSHRMLEDYYFKLDLLDEGSSLEQVMGIARNRYRETVSKMSEIFQKALFDHNFHYDSILSQTQIFSEIVAPHLTRPKIAYLWIDALRYEMGEELISLLGEQFNTQKERELNRYAVSVLPTLTQMGMAALLPHAETGFSLKEQGGKLCVIVGSEVVLDRAARTKYLSKFMSGHKLCVTKLGDLVSPNPKTKKEVRDSKFILVTSQDIDEMCETGDVTGARRTLNLILEDIKRVIVNLTTLGVDLIVLTADHGHLFFDKVDSGYKLDNPKGTTLEIHRRVWIGKGGDKNPSYLRVDGNLLNYLGDLELVFPRNIACFKVTGADNPYFHGGISLQEMVVPVLCVSKNTARPHEGMEENIKLKFDKQQITTRFISIKVEWESPVQKRLGSELKKRVKALIRDGKVDVGAVVQATSGFNELTKEVTLEEGTENHLTLMLDTEGFPDKVNIHLLDAETLLELDTILNIPVKISL